MKEKITTDLFKRLEKLYTGLICDVLDDELGIRDNVYIMSYEIRPLYFGAVVTGRAVTALAVPVYTEPEKPYQMELEFVEFYEKRHLS